jgi:hypothetical protein
MKSVPLPPQRSLVRLRALSISGSKSMMLCHVSELSLTYGLLSATLTRSAEYW